MWWNHYGKLIKQDCSKRITTALDFVRCARIRLYPAREVPQEADGGHAPKVTGHARRERAGNYAAILGDDFLGFGIDEGRSEAR